MDCSPLSACSNDSDSDARVYFGPMLSPEKRQLPFLPASSPTITFPFTFVSGSSNIHCLPDVATSPSHTEDRIHILGNDIRMDAPEGEEEEETSLAAGPLALPLSWSGTPLQNILREDEPSSAIANRIVRAIDNPSPPPKALRMSITPRRTSQLVNEFKFPSIETDEEDEVDQSSSIDIQPARMSAFSPSHLDTMPAVSPAPHITVNAPAEDSGDLISFEKTVVLSSPPDTKDIIHSPSPFMFMNPLPTADDLLCSPSLPEAIESAQAVNSVLAAPGRSSPASMRRSPRLSSLPPQRLLSPERAKTPERSRSRSPSGKKRLRNGEDKCLIDWLTSGSDEDDDRGGSLSPSPGKRRSKKRVKVYDTEHLALKELQLGESLSPESAQILSTLMKSKSPQSTDIEMKDTLSSTTDQTETPVPQDFRASTVIAKSRSPTPEAVITSTRRKATTLQRPHPGNIVCNPSTPTQAAFTSRNLLHMCSPVKLTLTPAPENPNRTPARRVPLFAAPETSALPSGSRVLAPGVVFTPVFSRPPIDSPARSPARRIPVTEAMSSDVRSRSRSPLFQTPHLSMPTDRKPASTIPDTKEEVNGLSLEESSKTVIAGPSRPNYLCPSVQPAALSAPSKVSLIKKAPSTSQVTGSKIPRVGTVPKTGVTTRKSKLPMLSSKKSCPGAAISSPSKLSAMRFGLSRGESFSGSDDLGLLNGVAKSKIRVGPPVSGISSRLKLPVGGDGGGAFAAHKRKRLEKPSPPRTLIKMRQVVPGMFGGPVKRISSNVNSASTNFLPDMDKGTASPVKPQQLRGPIKGREVVKGTLQDFELRNETSTRVEAALMEAAEARARDAEARKVDECKLQEVDLGSHLDPPHGSSSEDNAQSVSVALAKRICDDTDMDIDQREVQVSTDSSSDPVASLSLHQSENSIEPVKASLFTIGQPPSEPASSSRRSSRTRKLVSRSDVFGPVSNLPSTVPQRTASRRAGSLRTSTPKSGPLLITLDGPSGLELKSITNKNTNHNQRYHAQLEIESLIIRRPGDRPESPTMKIRTISEKMKDEQAKRRDERARRRRGDSDADITVSDDSEGLLGTGTQDGRSLDSIMDLDDRILKHRRGPGEDEDFESPVRSEQDGSKRVKWDRGLHTEVFLDEIEFNLERRPSNRTSDGLVSKIKKIPLDNMGNLLLENDTPIDLVPEKVVVTKYVYDNDELPPAIAPTPPPRTRSKTKGKGRSKAT